MNNFSSNTLIISFYFPPFARVGGRRWAKHAKYLQAQGLNVWVLAADIVNDSSTSWINDTASYKDRIVRIPAKIKYPFFKRQLPNTIFEKVIWKLSLYYWRYKEKKTAGNLWDDSEGYQDQFYLSAKNVIRKNDIKVVVLSIGPYHYATIIKQLKKEFGHVKFVIDYRDYWEDGLEELSLTKKNAELDLQQQVLHAADALITVNDEMTNHFKVKLIGKRIFTLPHCYDPADMQPTVVSTKRNREGSSISFIYGGALYGKMDNHMTVFGHFIDALKKDNYLPNVNFYSPQPAYETILNNHDIQLNKYLPLKEYVQKMLAADYVLFFRPDWSPNAFSSKFFEMISLRKPILYFGPESEVSRFLIKNNLGIHFNEQNFKESFNKFIVNLEKGDIPNFNYDINQHTFENKTKELVSFLNEL